MPPEGVHHDVPDPIGKSELGKPGSPPATGVGTGDGAKGDAPAPWHALPAEEVVRRLVTSPDGLSQAEAEARLQRYGPNQIQDISPPSVVLLLLRQFTNPFVIVLLVAGIVTAVLGEWVDTAVIGAALVLNAVIGFVQEHRAEQSIRALMHTLAPRARVVRDGVDVLIESRALVPGDVVLLESGVRVPADVRLLAASALQVDESLLTGESVPVVKRTDPVDASSPLADRWCMAYAGTIVTSGRGRGVVVATGPATELGQIAAASREETQPETPLQRRMRQFTRAIALVVLASVVVIAAFGLARGDDPLLLFTFAVAAAVSIVPEGLPVVLTIVLAVSVQRMARRNAIVRNLPAVETLGSATVIGTDKTGTLTENRMTVRAVWSAGELHWLGEEGADPIEEVALPTLATGDDDLHPVLLPRSPLLLTLLAGVLANEAHLRRDERGELEGVGDPTEVALLRAAAELGVDPAAARARWPVVLDVPFEPERRFSAAVCRCDDGVYLFVKGAPERVLAMSDSWLTPDGSRPLDQQAVLDAVNALGRHGLRALAMAYRPLDRVPDDDGAVLEPHGLVLVGLQGMWDPPRPGVAEAVARCRAAGIRVVMITGDHAETARAIAREVGITAGDAPVLTGAEIAALPDEAFAEVVRSVDVYARVDPLHKLRIVRALQAHGEVVAVTGDGVNDAPALRAADVGVAMGRSGTDVAREAADVVLADDNFVTIAAAVEEGRGAFDNVRKATFFLVSTNAAMLFALPAAVFLGWPLPFLPAQLLWLNVVTDTLQDVTMAFEPKEPDVMQRPPRPRHEGILSRLLWERMVVSGLVMAAGALWVFDWVRDSTGSVELARTVALTAMVVYQVAQAWNARSATRSVFRISPFSNPFLFAANGLSLLVHVAALYVPLTQFVLRVEPIPLEVWPRIVALALSLIAVVEVHKLVRRRWPPRDAVTA